MEAIFMGASQSRNPNLAAVLYRLGLVESYGTGVRKILGLYRGFYPPVFRSAEGVFTVEMSNRNELPSETNPATLYESTTAGLNNGTKEEVFEYIKEKGEATRQDIEKEFRVGSTKAFKLLKQLCGDGVLIQNKNGNRTTYFPT